jgi:hypothetical protein
VGEDPGCGRIETERREQEMWIVAIAWMYVTLMMALAEATSPQGTVLGAVFTFLMYGVGPLALVLYLLGAPARRKAIRQAEQAELLRLREQAAQTEQTAIAQSAQPSPEQGPADAAQQASASAQADGGGLPTAAPVAPVREEPPGR